MQPDSAELSEYGGRVGSDIGPDGTVSDSGGDVLAEVGAERFVSFAKDSGQLSCRRSLGPQQQECPVKHPRLAERSDLAVDQE